MKTLNLNNTNEEIDLKTSIKIDNSTNFKDFEISQGTDTKANDLFIQIDKESDTITIGKIEFSGINKIALLEFINQ